LPEPTLPPPVTPPAGDSLAGNTTNPLFFELLIAKQKDESIFLINQTGMPLPLEPLQFASKDRLISIEAWGIAQLGQGDCISAWKDKGKAKGPDVTCNEIGRLSVENKDRFWRETFEVYYGGEQLARCDKDQERCLVTIPVELLGSNNRIDGQGEADDDGGGGDDD
jgi:hypothetical protein